MDSGYGYGSRTELSEVSGTGMKVLQNFQKFRVMWHGRTELTEVPGGHKMCCTRTPGIVAWGVQNLDRTHRSSGHYGTGVQNIQKFRVRV